MRRAVTVLALLLAAGPAAAQDTRDIPYFERNPAERRAVLRRCQADVRLARTAVCQNAEAAGAGQLGRPLPPASVFPPPDWRVRPPPPPGKARDRAS